MKGKKVKQMSKARIEAVKETQAWLQRNNDTLKVIEYHENDSFNEWFIQDEDGYTSQVYISDFVQVVNENIHGKK